MQLPLACADFTFPLLSHEKALDLVRLLDFNGVDIGLFEGRSHLWPSREFQNIAKSGRALRERVGERGLKLADLFLQVAPDFTSLAINHPNATKRRKARDLFSRTLEYAHAAGSSHLSALPGVYFPEEPKATSWQRCCDELAWRVARAEEANIPFGIEPHIGSIIPKPANVLRLVHDVPGLTLTLDYTHFTSRIDVLVNNAAVCPQIPFMESTESDWDRLMNINARSQFFLTQAVCGVMKRQGRGGRIVNIASTGGRVGAVSDASIYSGTKGAIVMFSKSIAREVAADGILINCVAPGPMDTGLMRGLPPEKLAALTGQIPLRRLGDPREVAELVAYLSSDACSYSTGATYDINGGWIML